MKIAWFTPFNPKSAIGQESKLICETLAKTDDVAIWTSQKEDVIATHLPVISFQSGSINLNTLNKYDWVVYNMGNSAINHADIWGTMQRYPGILLLHDQIYQNFFTQILMQQVSIGEGDQYRSMMRKWYGVLGEEASQALYAPYWGENKVRLWESAASMLYPLFEPLVSKSLAVFTHAAFFNERLKDYFYGPGGFAYLPYNPSPMSKPSEIPKEFSDGSKALVVSSGIVHPVKRIERVVEMLLANPDIAKKLRYVVIGDFGGPYGDYLHSIAEGPLHGCFYLLGYQPDNVMESFLLEANFCVNIRYPNSEVCSKTLIDQMAAGKPVIVLNNGIYAEIPDDCVLKIDLKYELNDLASAFRYLLQDEAAGAMLGQRAAAFVEKNCSIENYASKFKSFLNEIPEVNANTRIVNESIALNRSMLESLSLEGTNGSWSLNALSRQLSTIFSASLSKKAEEDVLGIWLGFPYEVDLRREGIIKFLLYMLIALLEKYSIKCEMWTYSCNEKEIRISFESLLTNKDLSSSVKLITEKNYSDVLGIPQKEIDPAWVINPVFDNLTDLVRKYSKAHCFVTPIVYLDNVIETGRPLFVPVHDLGVHAHYDDFVTKDPLYKARFVDIRSRAENFARAGAFMFSNSEHIRQDQVLKYISSIDEKRTTVVYLPVNIPKNLDENLLNEKDVRTKFNLKGPYIFYPTQVRPYKNVSTLIEALSILTEQGLDINLVLTGTPSDVPEVDMAIQRLKLKEKIICLSSVKEYELYSLYRYASAAVVPTLFEGGFPWQACEALFMDTPLVLSDIPVVRERIEFHGMTIENCGLELFDPLNANQCARAVMKVVNNMEETLKSQKHFKDVFLKYSWAEAADRYYNMFFAR